MQVPATACDLCGRTGLELTRHHLIPRMRHRNKRVRRIFERDEMQHRVLWVCRPCHSHVHRTFTEKELALHYNTRERILEHPAMIQFCNWIRSKPAGFRPKAPGRRKP